MISNPRYFLKLLFLIFSCGIFAQSSNSIMSNDISIHQDLATNYSSDVVGISDKGVIRGLDAMKSYLKDFESNYGSILELKTHYKRTVMGGLDYEIGSFRTDKGQRFAHIIIWQKNNDQVQKILEVNYKMSNTNEIPDGITVARNKWVELCNSHKSDDLIRQLYTDDTIYFNRGRLLRGHDELSREYAYMQSPLYKLQLTPEHTEMVNDKMAFEIGKCSGSYNLPYIIIWTKQDDGSWKVFMDSNY